MSNILPAIRYHGAKFRLAKWILPYFPQHQIYVEPFGGAGGVLLHKERSGAEVYNDLDGNVVNYFRVLRDPVMQQQLIDAVAMTPYARAEFEAAWEPTTDQVELARRLAVRAQMGFGSAGATKGTTGFRIDVRRRYGTAQNLWTRFSQNIAFAGQRFQDVLIENRPAIDVMAQHDGPETLHFVDPPYVHETRCRTRTGGYTHEMTDADHAKLLESLQHLTGMVIVCGYMTDLYREGLSSWSLRTTQARISAGRGTAIRQECIWINPACMDALSQQPLALSGGGFVA